MKKIEIMYFSSLQKRYSALRENCVEFLRFSFEQQYIIHSCLIIHTCTYAPTNRKEKSFGSLEIVGGI